MGDDRRFAFGKNWKRFLRVLDEDRISIAEESLKEMLGLERLEGKTFLDVGCGSGLFSLAAFRLGAERVHSIDYDEDSVVCTRELRSRQGQQTERWTVERGDAVDREAMLRIGRWDVVYSWGVLHHTGAMWQALENVVAAVEPGGLLFVSLYNDQGNMSRFWAAVKRTYNSGSLGKAGVSAAIIPYYAARGLLVDLIRLRNPRRRYREYRRARGMSAWHDWVDWLGGYPFEVAKPEAVFDFCAARGFALKRLKTCGGGLGCNEFVFRRSSEA